MKRLDPQSTTCFCILSKIFSRKAAVIYSDPLAVEIQDEWDRNKSYPKESQRAASPIHTQILVHGSSEEREPCTKRTSHEVVTCQHRGCYCRVSVGQVIQDRVEEEECPNTEPCATDDWHNPMLVASAPAKLDGQISHGRFQLEGRCLIPRINKSVLQTRPRMLPAVVPPVSILRWR